jgi:hypothetical protein
MSKFKSLPRDIRQVLVQNWDPIGIADIPEAHDEYDSYIPEIARMIVRRGSADDIAKLLLAAEQNMGVEPNADRASEVARRLLGIGSGPNIDSVRALP